MPKPTRRGRRIPDRFLDARGRRSREAAVSESPSTGRTVMRTLALLLPLVGIVLLTVLGFIYFSERAKSRRAADALALQQSAVDQADAQRRQADQDAADARAQADRKVLQEYADFRKATLAWVKAGRAITLMLRSAPSPGYMHQRIRDAAECLADVKRITAGHVVTGRNGPVAKKEDVIGILGLEAEAVQRDLASTEDMAEAFMGTLTSGEFGGVGALATATATSGRTLDEMLDAIEDLVKPTDPPSLADVRAAGAKLADGHKAIAKAAEDLRRGSRQ
jgi:hypothetical protein